MIETVNSALANASILRPQDSGTNASAQNAPQTSSSPSEAGVSVPKAPYISPHIEVDLDYDKAVLQVRDSETGDVVRQFPSESRLQELRRQAAAQAQTAALTNTDTDSDSSEISDTGETGGFEPSVNLDTDTQALAQAQSAAAALSDSGQTSSQTNLSSSSVSFLA